MKMYLISDNIATQIGMRLAGIEGCVVHEYDETINAVKNAVQMPDIAILLITEKVNNLIGDYIKELKLTIHKPIITQIPDRHGSNDIVGSINSLVQESIGLKLSKEYWLYL